MEKPTICNLCKKVIDITEQPNRGRKKHRHKECQRKFKKRYQKILVKRIKNKLHIYATNYDFMNYLMSSESEKATDIHDFIVNNFWHIENYEELWSIFLSNPKYIKIYDKRLVVKNEK